MGAIGIGLAIAAFTKKCTKGGMCLMKIEIPFLAAFIFLGTDLLARAAAQGIEQALLSTVVKYGVNGIRAGKRFLLDAIRWSR
jgi:hypothetical protein